MNRSRTRFAAARALTIVVVAAALAGPAGAQTAGGSMPLAKPGSVGFSAERLQRIDEVLQRHIDEKRISGAVALVARHGRVVYYKAHGLSDVEAKRPMRKDDIFQMASSTKPVTGVAIMMLVEEGKVHL